MAYKIVTLSERPDLVDRIKEMEGDSFPDFITQGDRVWAEVWPRMITDFADYQVFLFDEADTLLGIGNSVAFNWDGSDSDLPGFQEVLLRSVREYDAGIAPNTLHPVQAMTMPSARGQGLSQPLSEAIRTLTVKHGLGQIINIRPILKDKYPITPIKEYVEWQTEDGLPFEPWMRTMVRGGAEFIKVIEDSTVIAGTVSDWETWTGIAFPASGRYIVPGAHEPITVDIDKDECRYSEAHVMYRPAASDGDSEKDAS
ncbi:MAG: hypothetical protein ABGX04_02380 [Myxococcales bacterium]|nr:GNAT family N-acetyltransferase [Myxococcales bacterium]HIK84081.1 GNAT family N-acetyltransferase [Myxococcales bacterium]